MLQFTFLALFFTGISSVATQCPQGWVQSNVQPNKCYLIVAQRKNWFNAEQYCQNAASGSHLTSVSSAFENANINADYTESTSNLECDDIWIGANDIEITGKFVWSDGNRFQYSNWDAGQPDLTNQCVSSQARKTGKWKTAPCGEDSCFVCENYPSTMTTTTTTTPQSTTSHRPMTDCYDWLRFGGSSSDGIYRISPPGINPFNVWCDMTTDGGGWTVFQRRIDDKQLFYDRYWTEYKHGFNNGLNNSLWLGNDYIHILSTKDSNVELRIDLWGDRNPSSVNRNGYWFEKRTNFFIDNEANLYTLHISYSYTGNATADSFSSLYYSNGLPFSAVDVNNGDAACYKPGQRGGWWFANCSNEALNGKYVPPIWGRYGFFWSTGSIDINPNQSRMMLRSLL